VVRVFVCSDRRRVAFGGLQKPGEVHGFGVFLLSFARDA